MHVIRHSAAIIVASICVAGSAAAQQMTGEEIRSFLSGKTAYVQTGTASATGTIGEGAIYYGADGTGLYRTPTGAIWHGTWTVKDNKYCSEYKEGPKRPCGPFEKQGDTVVFIDGETGKVRIKITKTVPGNAENLK